jgi:hypothetical protein
MFKVSLWNMEKDFVASRGHDVTPMGLSKRFRKHYWAGRVEHIQTGEYKMFNSIGSLLVFMEKHRVKK